VLAIGLLALFLFLDFIEFVAMDKTRAIVARVLVGIALFAAFAVMLQSEKSQSENEQPPLKGDHIKQNFDMKVVTYVIATPDEIANALINEKQRPEWDLNVQSISKQGEDCFKT
jgi:hypothetical protein